MSDEVKAEGQYQGVEFVIDQYWRFYVPSLDEKFESFELLKGGIERSSKALEAADRRKLNIAVVTKAGKKAVVTGVHAGHGKLLTKPKVGDRFDDSAFYVDVQLTQLALAEQRRLESDLRDVERVLRALQLNNTGYRRFDVSMHSSECDRVENKASSATRVGGLSLREAIAKLPKKSEDEDE